MRLGVLVFLVAVGTAAVMIFGLLGGLAVVYAAAMLGAVAAFWLCRWLGQDAVEKFTATRVEKVNQMLSRRSLAAMIGVSLVPALPFTVINYAAGLTSLSWWHYVLGTAITVNAGTRSAALLAPEDPRDLEVRDGALAHFGTMIFGSIQKRIVAARILRALLTHPADLPHLLSFTLRVLSRVRRLRVVASAAVKRRLKFRTFVVRNFMDAADVASAWALIEQGVASEDPTLKATQERLGACMDTMSHPETGKLVPACVQHSVLDAGENI